MASNMSDERFVATLKTMTYHCEKCGSLVTEYNNIGQWKCFEMKSHPLTGEQYRVPADHGELRRAKWVISLTKAQMLPRMDGEVFQVYMIRYTDNTRQYQVSISRWKKELNQYDPNFIVHGIEQN